MSTTAAALLLLAAWRGWRRLAAADQLIRDALDDLEHKD